MVSRPTYYFGQNHLVVAARAAFTSSFSLDNRRRSLTGSARILELSDMESNDRNERTRKPICRRPKAENTQASGSSTKEYAHLQVPSTSTVGKNISAAPPPPSSRRPATSNYNPTDSHSTRPRRPRRLHATQFQKESEISPPTVRNGGRIRVDLNSTRVLQMREQVKHRIEAAVRSNFGTKYRIEFFGSTRYGVSYADSDLDMTIIDPDNPQGYVESKYSDPIYNPRKLEKCIRRAGYTEVECRPHSSVPIVKFRDRSSGLECDLNINERLGIHNSDLIKQYCETFPPLRPTLFGIKEWAKPLGLNSPSGEKSMPVSFSSYALTLMTIGFLQSEGYLPNLQADLPSASPEENPVMWTRKPHKGWDMRFRTDISPRPFDEISLDNLLDKWFRFWSDFPCEERCISVRNGGIANRNDPEVLQAARASSSAPSPICIVDPFIIVKNCTKAINTATLKHFKNQCAKAVAHHAVIDQMKPAQELRLSRGD